MLMLILFSILLFFAVGASAIGNKSQQAMEKIFDNERKNE